MTAKKISKDNSILKKITSKTADLSSKYGKRAAVFIKDQSMLLIPLSRKKKFSLVRLSPYLSQDEIQKVRNKIKQKKAVVRVFRKGFSFLVCERDIIPRIISNDLEMIELNKKINRIFWENAVSGFSKRAWQAIPEYIAPNTLGMKHVKQSIALMLASKTLKVLLVGNPSVSKKEFISNTLGLSYEKILSAENASGSKSRVSKLKSDFDSYEKAIVSANFKEEFFVNVPSHVIKQTGLEAEFAYLFDLIFVIKPVDVKKFQELAESILYAKPVEINEKDVKFIRKYLSKTQNIFVTISDELLEKISQFCVFLKENEHKLLKPVNEKTVTSIMEMVKASARLDMRNDAEEKDLDRVFDIFRKSLD